MGQARDKTLFEGKFLRLIDRDTWEFAQRSRGQGVVGIVAVTPDNKLLLIEQFRPALRQSVIEIPAGLAGDSADSLGEDLAKAARRELIEETGYDAEKFVFISHGPSSAGLSDEVIALYRAENLKRVASGGGDASENITVHEVPLGELFDWLTARAAEGRLIDFKAWAALALLTGRYDT